ncbi:MAG: hypothetical protein QMB29_05610 [Urechidicola sp.]|jgi:hypothetical protein
MNITIKITLLFFFISNIAMAQFVTIRNVESTLVTHQGIEFTGKLIDKTRDLHMFSDWKNQGVIHMDGKVYRLRNINLNVSDNTIDSKVKEKYFIYKSRLIDSISINNRNFKRLGRSFYEVLLEKKDNLFLKKFDSRQLKSKSNRLGGTIVRTSKILKFKYLIQSNDEFIKIELNKKSILGLFEDKQDILLNYVKDEKLSYKKEEDLIKILNFMFDKVS